MSVGPEVERLALQFWREREMQLPAYARVMSPDECDKQTAAWKAMLARAEATVRGMTGGATVVPFR